MGPRDSLLSSSASLTSFTGNKQNRQSLFIKRKRARDSAKRDVRFRRKRAEDQEPQLREDRLRRNKPATLDSKRIWDHDDDQSGDEEAEATLGNSVDVAGRLKRRRTSRGGSPAPSSSLDAAEVQGAYDSFSSCREEIGEENEDEEDSMLDSDSEPDSIEEEEEDEGEAARPSSPAPSTTSTTFTITPEALATKFPTLFTSEAPPDPKILVTTSLNSTLYHEAELLTTLFPNSVFIRRSSHRYGHKFSVREIARFATNRQYTALVVLEEDQKRPTGLSVTHLPAGPTLHFSISNWIEGKKLPGHGRASEHYPELILNNFRTPLGLVTAQLFRRLFPARPEIRGRQVVTLHNQRDYIFVRRHRYVFREKRGSEKSVVGADGKEVAGLEGIRAGLQELGPRLTLKLRRVDRGVGRADERGVEWEWKSKMEKQRTKFQL